MPVIGLIREGKVPADNRVAFTPAQCKWMQAAMPQLKILVQTSPNRCFTDAEYVRAGATIVETLEAADIILGIKEVPVDWLLDNKTYLFFSHTKKKQPHNRYLLQTILKKNITLIDYECLEHEDGQRVIGFGFFAGIVGAHNGIMCYGHRTGSFHLPRVYKEKDYRSLIHHYFGLKLPSIKIAVTGSGRVAHGITEIMNLMGVHEVEPEEYLQKKYPYPVYTQLKGADLYTHKDLNTYRRAHFHQHPQEYKSKFLPYARCTDVLLNGVYWDETVPRLFELNEIDEEFAIQTIADVTDDKNGSVPINLGEHTIEDLVYGVCKKSFSKTTPYLLDGIDVIAVGNLPNELPRDASTYFGEQLIKFVMEDVLKGGSAMIERATLTVNGQLTPHYHYLQSYVNE
jgi:saccharopine dehydrogenase (NAD+, L-lysine forming)